MRTDGALQKHTNVTRALSFKNFIIGKVNKRIFLAEGDRYTNESHIDTE